MSLLWTKIYIRLEVTENEPLVLTAPRRQYNFVLAWAKFTNKYTVGY